MPSRRARTYAFYRNPAAIRRVLLEKSASAAGEYSFHGSAVTSTAVVRLDLNGYSSSVRDRDIAVRAAILDDFFSKTMPKLADAKGIFFRDEGDCIVCLFSDYFGAGATPASVLDFCKHVVSDRYGAGVLGDEYLTAKASVAYGSIAYFQKAHEAGSDDWSAEGEPFVRAARIEQAIESTRQIVLYAAEYDAVFAPANARSFVPPGTVYYWEFKRRNLQIPGLQLAGGWADVVSLEHIPQGRV
jgi:hypothetical protein